MHQFEEKIIKELDLDRLGEKEKRAILAQLDARLEKRFLANLLMSLPEEKRSELDQKIEALQNPKPEDVFETAIELHPEAQQILEKSAKEIIDEMKSAKPTPSNTGGTSPDYYQPTKSKEDDIVSDESKNKEDEKGANMNDDNTGGVPPFDPAQGQPAGGTPPPTGGSDTPMGGTTPPPFDPAQGKPVPEPPAGGTDPMTPPATPEPPMGGTEPTPPAGTDAPGTPPPPPPAPPAA